MNYRKLPSGNWQVREFVTKIGNKNQEIYATGATKKEARQKLELKKSFGDYSRMTVTSACEKYLEIKRPVLAPSTHRGYMGTFRTHIENTQIGNTKLSSLTQARIQTWVSGMAKDLLAEVNLRTPQDPRVVYVSELLEESLKEEIIKVLQEFKDCFA